MNEIVTSGKSLIDWKKDIQNVRLEFCVGNISQMVKSTLPEIVFSGRSNVGKSTLINKVLQQKSLARVSSKPGKTVTINYYNISNKIRFVDLPGYGYAKASNTEKARWFGLVDNYFNNAKNIKLVMQLVDSRHGFTADDLQMLDYLKFKEISFLIVATKADKLTKSVFYESKQKFEKTIKDKFEDSSKTFHDVVFSDLSQNSTDSLRKIISSLC